MIKINIKVDPDQTAEIGECRKEVELSMGKNYRGRSQYDQKYRSDFRRENF